MEKYVYIKKSIEKHFVDFAEPLSSEEYNNLGTEWQDYLDNKWVLLSDAQILFHTEHPEATPRQVWDMDMHNPDTHIRTLDDAKKDKIISIEEYDASDSVNSFSLGNQQMWLTVEERQQLATQISANLAFGRVEMTRWFNGVAFTFPITLWQQMLTTLEVYAGDALNVTEAHKAAVGMLTTIEEVDAYDITAGYPNRPIFNI